MIPLSIPIVALDVSGADEARALVDRLAPEVSWVKIGLQLFTAAGPDLVRTFRGEGLRVFLDLKLHDIPNTVGKAVEAAADLGVEILTVHASGGAAMMDAARRAAGSPGAGGPEIFAVTVLTSLSAADLALAWGVADDAASAAARLAQVARDGGADGVVCSAWEIQRIRAATNGALRFLVPGIRLAGDPAGDQTRTATPAQATGLGADYLVVGRSITAATDPAAALQRVMEEVRRGAEQDVR